MVYSHGSAILHGQRVETYPPAKLNLFLELLGKRQDGFHELETVMVAVDRRDYLSMAWYPEWPAGMEPGPDGVLGPDGSGDAGGVRLRASWSPESWECFQRLRGIRVPESESEFAIPRDQRNLVVRAIQRFQQHFGLGGCWDVVLVKHIPAGAGMGGASSDAASALMCAAQLQGLEDRELEIYDLAAELGSDVPFFLGRSWEGAGRSDETFGLGLRGGVAAVARGRGEKLSWIPMGRAWHYVVVYPPHPVSTGACYAGCEIPESPTQVEPLLRALREGDVAGLAAAHVNRLLAPACKISPVIEEVLEAIRREGLENVTMTGSGAACFGIARNARHARVVARRLSSRGLGLCFAAAPIALPAPVYLAT